MVGHIREKRWYRNQTPYNGIGLSDEVKECAQNILSATEQAEYMHEQLLAIWGLASDQEYIDELSDSMKQEPNDQLVANNLFREIWGSRISDPVNAPGVFDIQANKDEVAMVVHLRLAGNALNLLSKLFEDGEKVGVKPVQLLRKVSW